MRNRQPRKLTTPCLQCGKPLTPHEHEFSWNFAKREHCDNSCAQKHVWALRKREKLLQPKLERLL